MKQTLRKQIKQALADIPPEQALTRSCAAARHLTALPEFTSAKVVMLYLTIPGEVDTQPLAQAAWAAGKIVVAPTACETCRGMRPIICPPDTEDMFHPHHGLRQPDRVLGEMPIDRIDLVIVPALAFDRQCNRLGRGGGFYDRFLPRLQRNTATVGLAFAEQILPKLPILPNDHPVDVVVTDREVIRPIT